GKAAFFMGEYSASGWWNYFLVAILIKTPLAISILVGASLVLCRAGQPLGRREAIFLLTPVIVFLAFLMRARLNLGLRHALPLYPFLLLLAARLATVQLGNWRLMPAVLTIFVGLAAMSSLRTAPHQLAYFNEAVGGPGQGYRYLSDSNLDWGQDLRNL